MACGAAVACSNRGGLAEVTGNAAVLIDPDDPNGMAEILAALANDPQRRLYLQTLAQERVLSSFSLDWAIRQLDDGRDRIMAAQGRG